MALYAFPRVGRTGLGNGLFPWARAELFARDAGARVLAPRWPLFRVGPYLRNEPDKRDYGGFFASDAHVDGIERTAVLVLGRRISESDAHARSAKATLRPVVVEFNGMDELFVPLAGHHAFVRGLLWNLTQPKLRSTGIPGGSAFVAMHVRRGDLTRQGFTAAELDAVKQYTPLAWFESMARALRAVPAMRAVPIVVFTDGTPEEIAALLAIDGVALAPRAPAITDLWTMAHAELLFASGFSTFGMWASYLGGMPTLYAPGKIQQRVQTGRSGAFEAEVAAGSAIPDGALRLLPA